MTAALVLSGVVLWVGLTLLLSELRWFARRPLAERIAPYVPGGLGRAPRAGVLSVASFRDAVGPLARDLGARFARTFGVQEDLERRLRRIHADLDVTEFRVRQLGWSLAGFGAGALVTVVAHPPAVIGVLLVVGGLLLPFLLLEHQVAGASDRWRATVELELPVVAEQIGTLLGAGYSLTGALDRTAVRGDGAVARDLRRVLLRVRQGLATELALREWAELAEVEPVDRLVAVLAVDRDAGDLGRLIAGEARTIRRDGHRRMLELLERRAQQVWVPVTVATLLPGVLFLAIPFRAALQGFLS
jgi:tight adherence protein C